MLLVNCSQKARVYFPQSGETGAQNGTIVFETLSLQ